MALYIVLALAFCVVSSHAQTAPFINGPSTGVCGPIPIRYGTSGAGDAKVQTFLSPAPLFISACFPGNTDAYVYTLGVNQQSNYLLPGPAVRRIGTDQSPAFGYRGTPNLDLTTAVPNSGLAPLPVPAGFLDVHLSFLANTSSNANCANTTNTLTSAFLIQAPTATSVSGPLVSTTGDPLFKLYINVTYSAAAIQLPFSDPTAVQGGSVAVSNSVDGTPLTGYSSVASSGPGFVTFAFTPSSPLPPGAYIVNASYTSSAAYVLGSSSTQPFAFTVVMMTSTPPPTTSTPMPTTSTPMPTTQAPAPTTQAPTPTTPSPPSTITPTPSTKIPVTTPTPTPTINPAVVAAQAKLDADLAKLQKATGFARFQLLLQIARDYAALLAAQRAAGVAG